MTTKLCIIYHAHSCTICVWFSKNIYLEWSAIVNSNTWILPKSPFLHIINSRYEMLIDKNEYKTTTLSLQALKSYIQDHLNYLTKFLLCLISIKLQLTVMYSLKDLFLSRECTWILSCLRNLLIFRVRFCITVRTAWIRPFTFCFRFGGINSNAVIIGEEILIHYSM